MCFRISRDFSDVEVFETKEFKIDAVLEHFGPRYNVPITTKIPVIVPGSRILDMYKWGLIPHFIKDAKIGYKLANARSETLEEKKMFKESFRSKRCLILASGFYEWDKDKNPYYFSVKGKNIFAFAGLYDKFIDDNGNEVKTCTIITCEPSKEIKKIHDRMPVILDAKDFDLWLKGEDIEEVKTLLKPYEGIKGYHVTRKVNSVKYEGKDAIIEERGISEQKSL